MNFRSRSQKYSAWRLRHGALTGHEPLPDWLEDFTEAGELSLSPGTASAVLWYDGMQFTVPSGHWFLFSESGELRVVSPEALAAHYALEG